MLHSTGHTHTDNKPSLTPPPCPPPLSTASCHTCLPALSSSPADDANHILPNAAWQELAALWHTELLVEPRLCAAMCMVRAPLEVPCTHLAAQCVLCEVLCWSVCLIASVAAWPPSCPPAVVVVHAPWKHHRGGKCGLRVRCATGQRVQLHGTRACREWVSRELERRALRWRALFAGT